MIKFVLISKKQRFSFFFFNMEAILRTADKGGMGVYVCLCVTKSRELMVYMEKNYSKARYVFTISVSSEG